MKVGTATMLAAALVCAACAALLARSWMLSQSAVQQHAAVRAEAPAGTVPVMVASRDLVFGATVTPDMVREARWPQNALPKGVFNSKDALLGANGKEKRVLATSIAENEPILATKLVGGGQDNALSIKIGESLKAVTIRVNDVAGVGGFVQPEDRVDVFLTQLDKSDEQNRKGKTYTLVLLQNIRVLATDQQTQRKSQATPPKAVTLEVNTEQAQKLTLAGQIGELSLVLNRVNAVEPEASKPIDIDDLLDMNRDKVIETAAPVVGVTRAAERKEYKVKMEGSSTPGY